MWRRNQSPNAQRRRGAAEELNKDLIHRANNVTALAERGDISEHEYQVYVERGCLADSEEKNNPFWINCMRNGVKC